MSENKGRSKAEQAHMSRVNRYGGEIKEAYRGAIDEAVKVASKVSFDTDKPFSFTGYKKSKEIETILDRLSASVTKTIMAGAAVEWGMSNKANDKLVDSVFTGKGVSKDKIGQFYQKNIPAFEAFQRRKINGFSLSDRVWNQTQQFKTELEMAIDVGLLDGRSAAQMSRDIRGYLNEPNKLFRRVRDARGNLQLSKAAKAYHPGQGVYRSSFKNAFRLARTETNIAYRSADNVRWKQLPFILGYEVKLSGAHPVYDICDMLAGQYPVGFKFTGWHPQCFCFMVPIIAGDDDFDSYIDNILGEDGQYDFSGKVEKLPDNFIGWAQENFEKVAGAKGTPYFIADNLDKRNILESAMNF